MMRLGAPTPMARILGLNRALDVDTFPTPPEPWKWSPTGMLLGTPDLSTVDSGLGPDGYTFRLEGTPIAGGILEWVGHAGSRVEAIDMSEWLVLDVRLYAYVQAVEIIHSLERIPFGATP
jgi:hypothetical protein